MKHVSSCLSVLVLSTLLFPFSIRGQTAEPTTGKVGTGVSGTSAPGGLSTINVDNYGA